MKISSIAEELNSLAYHGRGIIIGKSADGKKAVTALIYCNQRISYILFKLKIFFLR